MGIPGTGVQKNGAREDAVQAYGNALRPCQTLYQVTRAVNSSLDVMQVLDIIVRSVVEALGAKACSLRLLSPDNQRLFVGAAHGLSANYRSKGPVDVANSEVDRLALGGSGPVYVADAGAANGGDTPHFQYPAQAHAEGIASVLVTALRVREQPIGVLRVYTDAPRQFTTAETDLVEAIAGLSALAIENARLYEWLDRNYEAALDFSERTFD
jgi:GAF domain-containing protein